MWRYISVKVAAKELDLTPRQVYNLCEKRFFGKRHGNTWRILRKDLAKYRKTGRIGYRKRRKPRFLE